MEKGDSKGVPKIFTCRMCNKRKGAKLHYKSGDLLELAHPICLSKGVW